jgi:hypothetical protein
MVCYISGIVFDVLSVCSREHFIQLTVKEENGNFHMITTPIEQIAFDIIISKKVNEEPPREIGFRVESVQKQA